MAIGDCRLAIAGVGSIRAYGALNRADRAWTPTINRRSFMVRLGGTVASIDPIHWPVGAAAVVALTHTLLGPDHYVPFLAMSQAGRWSLPKALCVTMACGVAHVLGSVAIGAIGVGMGLAVAHVEVIESARGGLAGWALLGFGLAYAVWGLRKSRRACEHSHWHTHTDGTIHAHGHTHEGNHAHVHAGQGGQKNLTPWILFTIFIFGPCEPLIPLLMFPAAMTNWWGLFLVTTVFFLVTLATMMLVVTAGYLGLVRLGGEGLQRHSHTLAGLTVAACGAAVKLGL